MKSNSVLSVAALAAALALPIAALAAGPEGGRSPGGTAKPQDMQQKIRESTIAHIDDRIEILQEAKSCVRAARDMKALSDCHTQERRKTKALRERARSNLLDQQMQRDERQKAPPVPAAK